MNVRFKKAFIKDLNNLPDEIKTTIQTIVFLKIPNTDKINEVVGIKKIKVYQNYFRIKVKDYKYFQEQIIFCRVLHRKEIYRYFP